MHRRRTHSTPPNIRRHTPDARISRKRTLVNTPAHYSRHHDVGAQLLLELQGVHGGRGQAQQVGALAPHPARVGSPVVAHDDGVGVVLLRVVALIEDQQPDLPGLREQKSIN